jgi:K+-transporting ATPase ATPase C chain
MTKNAIISAARMFLVLLVVTGIVYPVVMTLAAGALFPSQASGSLVTVDGQVVGSSLMAQPFTADRYFWPRPSAVNYGIDPVTGGLAASGGSNLGPTSADLQKAIQERAAVIRAKNGLAPDAPIPPDLLFASGSGLDPHISPAAARLQIDRVAKARGFSAAQQDQLTALVESSIEYPQLGVLGEPRVNVLMLNLALDQLK